MNARKAVPIDQALEEADELQRRRYQRPSPYRPVGLVLIEDEPEPEQLELLDQDDAPRKSCPWKGCDETKATDRALSSHIAAAHIRPTRRTVTRRSADAR